MSDIPDIKLIQAVDPTKIKVTINEKFSKLTLSSNKKNNKDADKGNQLKEIEKRQSASRNLMLDLVNNDHNEDERRRNSDYLNAILRSSSLSDNNVNNKSDLTETMSQIINVTARSKNLTAESMERLHMTEENEELDDLTQKVSNLTVRHSDEEVKIEKPSKTCSFNSSHIIELVSSDEEESVIYISDSEEENLPPRSADEYNLMVTSDIIQSGGTGQTQLPCTLSNERADRLEAFLHDVSQERRNIAASGGGLNDDSMLTYISKDNNRNSTDGIMQTEEQLKNCARAKLIATADTESMDTNTLSLRPSMDFQKNRAMLLNDTEPMSDADNMTLFSTTSNKHLNDELATSQEILARRLANDETEANTTQGSANDTIHNSDQSRLELNENESIVISETSSESNEEPTRQTPQTDEQVLITSEEALNESIRHDAIEEQDSTAKLCHSTINISAKINIKLQIKANFSCSDDTNTTYDSDDSGDSKNFEDGNPKEYNEEENEVRVDIDNNGEDDDDEVDDDNNNENSNCCDSNNDDPIKSKSSCAKNITVTTEHQKLMHNIDMVHEEQFNNNVNLLSSAEKLLTELYGKSWQTPDVIRTLKRTNGSAINMNNETTETNSAVKKKIPVKSQCVEESILDDFSTFRINIGKTNMDSTRLVTPKLKTMEKVRANEIRTDSNRKPKTSSKNNLQSGFKMSKTEFSKQKAKAMNERRRQLIDDDSQPDNCYVPDDDKIDKTVLTDDESCEDESNASDSSWQELTEESSDEDDEYNDKKTLVRTKKPNRSINKKAQEDRLIYMDLSKDEVSILMDTPQQSPPANHDANFRHHLSEILDSCRYEDRPKLEATPKSTGRSKRRLFNANYGDEAIDDAFAGETVIQKALNFNDIDENSEKVRFNGEIIPPSFNILDKRLEAVKTGKPVFKITPSRTKEPTTPIAAREETTPFKSKNQRVFSTPTDKNKCKLSEINATPSLKYSFLKSLDVCVGKSLCHPDALIFRENYRQKKEDLTKILYELYNKKLFNNELNVPTQWNKKLLNTAGRCLNKKKAGVRLSVVELSDKVLTSADRLRCTLIHELCHAATWVFDGEGGHGAKWKAWAHKANAIFPELPKIGVCHQYDIEYKYTYKCTLCAAKSYYHSKSKKVENIRCSYCYGAIEIFLNKKDKEGNIMPTPVREPTGFAKFVKEKYQQYKLPNMKHADVMKLLSNEYAALKVSDKA